MSSFLATLFSYVISGIVVFVISKLIDRFYCQKKFVYFDHQDSRSQYTHLYNMSIKPGLDIDNDFVFVKPLVDTYYIKKGFPNTDTRQVDRAYSKKEALKKAKRYSKPGSYIVLQKQASTGIEYLISVSSCAIITKLFKIFDEKNTDKQILKNWHCR